MPTIRVERRLRPIRFGFLVSPGDLDELRQVMEINSVLWGGRHNLIIPGWKRCPREHRGDGPARDLVRNFIDAAEPDFIVAGQCNPEAFGLDKDRVIPIADMLKRGLPSAGLSVEPLYQWLYKQEFRFEPRHPQRLVQVRAPAELATFSAARYGRFPSGWEWCERALREFGAEDVSLDEKAYTERLLRCTHPLVLGSEALDVRVIRRTAFLLLDPSNFVDLVDYWNLRAFGWYVLPIPLQWAESMAPVVQNILRVEHQPRQPLRPDITAGHVMKARSVSEKDFASFTSAIAAAGSETVHTQHWMPRYWHRDGWNLHRVDMPELSAAEDELELRSDDRRISFHTLAPPFIEKVRWGSSISQWANVISIRSYDVPDAAEVVPRGLDRIAHAVASGYNHKAYRCGTEGIAVLDHGKGGTLFWTLPTGAAVLEQLWKDRFTVDTSSVGRIASKLIRILGGPTWTRVACSPRLIRLFDEAARAPSRSLVLPKFEEALRKELRDDKEIAAQVLTRWTKSGVIQIGLHISCPECAQKNWYPLTGLRQSIQCQRCLEDFNFPVPPSRTAWAGRPLGPFAVEGHAGGAFSVALAIRLFRHFGGFAHTTWVPGLTIASTGGKSLELDFAMLWQSDSPYVDPTRLIIGECKTFGAFEKVDVNRMREAAALFPGAFLVFACLRDTLTPGEKSLIRPLAVKGRKNNWRNPVIVLTECELSGDWEPPNCWKSSTDKAVADQCPTIMTLTGLADATQQLRLGLPPGEGWPHPQWHEREAAARQDAGIS